MIIQNIMTYHLSAFMLLDVLLDNKYVCLSVYISLVYKNINLAPTRNQSNVSHSNNCTLRCSLENYNDVIFLPANNCIIENNVA